MILRRQDIEFTNMHEPCNPEQSFDFTYRGQEVISVILGKKQQLDTVCS